MQWIGYFAHAAHAGISTFMAVLGHFLVKANYAEMPNTWYWQQREQLAYVTVIVLSALYYLGVIIVFRDISAVDNDEQ